MDQVSYFGIYTPYMMDFPIEGEVTIHIFWRLLTLAHIMRGHTCQNTFPSQEEMFEKCFYSLKCPCCRWICLFWCVNYDIDEELFSCDSLLFMMCAYYGQKNFTNSDEHLQSYPSPEILHLNNHLKCLTLPNEPRGHLS